MSHIRLDIFCGVSVIMLFLSQETFSLRSWFSHVEKETKAKLPYSITLTLHLTFWLGNWDTIKYNAPLPCTRINQPNTVILNFLVYLESNKTILLIQPGIILYHNTRTHFSRGCTTLQNRTMLYSNKHNMLYIYFCFCHSMNFIY